MLDLRNRSLRPSSCITRSRSRAFSSKSWSSHVLVAGNTLLNNPALFKDAVFEVLHHFDKADNIIAIPHGEKTRLPQIRSGPNALS